jgi:hypothetical protein
MQPPYSGCAEAAKEPVWHCPNTQISGPPTRRRPLLSVWAQGSAVASEYFGAPAARTLPGGRPAHRRTLGGRPRDDGNGGTTDGYTASQPRRLTRTSRSPAPAASRPAGGSRQNAPDAAGAAVLRAQYGCLARATDVGRGAASPAARAGRDRPGHRRDVVPAQRPWSPRAARAHARSPATPGQIGPGRTLLNTNCPQRQRHQALTLRLDAVGGSRYHIHLVVFGVFL